MTRSGRGSQGSGLLDLQPLPARQGCSLALQLCGGGEFQGLEAAQLRQERGTGLLRGLGQLSLGRPQGALPGMARAGIAGEQPRAAGQPPAHGLLGLELPAQAGDLRALRLQLGLQPRQDQALLIQRVALQARQQLGGRPGHGAAPSAASAAASPANAPASPLRSPASCSSTRSSAGLTAIARSSSALLPGR